MIRARAVRYLGPLRLDERAEGGAVEAELLADEIVEEARPMTVALR